MRAATANAPAPKSKKVPGSGMASKVNVPPPLAKVASGLKYSYSAGFRRSE